MVRRLARNAKASEAFVHAALRLAAKQHLQEPGSSWRSHKSFRANLDTPSDIQASYLQNPHAFGLSRFTDVLSWAQQASSATLLKMTHFKSAALLVLMERNHGQAGARLNTFMANSTTDEFNDVKAVLLAQKAPWSRVAVQAFGQAQGSLAHRLWYKDVVFLKRFEIEASLQGQPGLSPSDARAFMGSYALAKLMRSWPTLALQSAALETAWERLLSMAGKDPDSMSMLACECKTLAQQGLDSWQRHQPTQEECAQLSLSLDGCVLQCPSHTRSSMTNFWRERPDWLEPWIRMCGNTPEASNKVWTLYTSVDPDLLSFALLAASVDPLPHENVKNLSESLCP